MQHTHGYVAKIVAGKITYQNGQSTDERPSSLVKSVKDTKQTHEFAN